ncbi:MAG: transposase [Bosea sp.]|nr:transposase [Bosea sp. (in: a-proteobacteria)]MCP4736514.1 transposase [Bosea sp. (in: a-proteobacteria)]
MSHRKIRRLMREHDLQPRRRRRFVATTDSERPANLPKPGLPTFGCRKAPASPEAAPQESPASAPGCRGSGAAR